MAFSDQHIALIAHGGQGNFKLWHYLTADAPATVDTAGYFDAKARELGLGDLILVVRVDDPAAPTAVTAVGWHVVVSNDGTTVDVSDATAIGLTDTD